MFIHYKKIAKNRMKEKRIYIFEIITVNISVHSLCVNLLMWLECFWIIKIMTLYNFVALSFHLTEDRSFQSH